MTRNDIISFGMDELGETDGDSSSFSPFAWDRLVTEAANYVARKTRCFYLEYQMDVVAGQSDYCASPLDRIIGGRVTDANGTLISLRFGMPADGFSMTGYTEFSQYGQQSGQGSGSGYSCTPRTMMALGGNSVRLYPTPCYSSDLYDYSDLTIGFDGQSVQSALRPFTPADIGRYVVVSGTMPALTSGAALVQPGNFVAGLFTPVGPLIPVTLTVPVFDAGRYQVTAVNSSGAALLNTAPGQPGAVAASAVLSSGGLYVEGYGQPAGSWPAPSDECPLPERAHMAVQWRALSQRCFRTRDMAGMQIYEKAFEQEKNLMVRSMAGILPVAENRRRAYASGGNWGYY